MPVNKSHIGQRQSGFTLIEIAVVLVIVGLLVGSFIGTFAQRIDTTRRDNTVRELLEIKKVLIAYAFTQTPPRLPCPDVTGDGIQDLVAGDCQALSTEVWFLPWQDLGLGFGDAWDNRYRYWVNNAYARNAGFDLNAADDAAGGNATIQTRVNDAAVNMLDNAVAVIFSHGKNSLDAVSIENDNRALLPAPGNDHDDEIGNLDNDRTFMSRSPSEEGSASTGGVYDDIVVWINSYEIKAAMVETGKLP